LPWKASVGIAIPPKALFDDTATASEGEEAEQSEAEPLGNEEAAPMEAAGENETGRESEGGIED